MVTSGRWYRASLWKQMRSVQVVCELDGDEDKERPTRLIGLAVD